MYPFASNHGDGNATELAPLSHRLVRLCRSCTKTQRVGSKVNKLHSRESCTNHLRAISVPCRALEGRKSASSVCLPSATKWRYVCILAACPSADSGSRRGRFHTHDRHRVNPMASALILANDDHPMFPLVNISGKLKFKETEERVFKTYYLSESLPIRYLCS
jgi:hypothetical protein